MKFVNNWRRAVVLAVGENSLALDLPDGSYRLTITDNGNVPTRWEIVDAEVVASTATLTRAREGTTEQTWPFGSVIYCSLTAELLEGLRGVISVTVNGSGHLILTYSDGATVDAGYVIGAPGTPGSPGTPGVPGTPGTPGVGISGASINGSGHLVLTYTTGGTVDAGLVAGEDGRGVTSAIVNVAGHLILTYTDGSTEDAGDVANGVDGVDGRGIADMTVDGDGHLIITYTDSATEDAGQVKGAKGDKGDPGAGDVVGPSASVEDEVALFSGTTGKLLKRGVFGALVRATVATGLVLTSAAKAVAGDTLLVILGKLQRQINDLRDVTIPVNSKSAAYTAALADAGTMIYHPPSDTTARIWTIPSNAAVPFEVGAAITFDNDVGAGAITIAITDDTLVLVGAGTTGSRALAPGGQATAVKVSTTRWRISGAGLS